MRKQKSNANVDTVEKIEYDVIQEPLFRKPPSRRLCIFLLKTAQNEEDEEITEVA